MSFSSDAKNELCKLQNKRELDDRAQGYGMLLFSKLLLGDRNSIKIENSAVARQLAEYCASLAGIIPELQIKMSASGVGKQNVCTFSLTDDLQKQQLMTVFGYNSDEPHINEELVKGREKYFLRGVFLISGVVTDPKRDYHLEMSVHSHVLANELSEVINSLAVGIQSAVLEKSTSKNGYIVYIKDSTGIEDFLTYIGASGASMEFMQIKMYKEAKNDINRKANFETANMDRTFSASAKQTYAIAVINDTIGFDELTSELRAVCELRLNNPEMTLKQMSEKLGISRSGVNHRFQRLIKIAEEISGGKKIEDLISR